MYLKVSDEVTVVIYTDREHYLLHAHEGCFQKQCRLLHSQRPEVMGRPHARLIAEEVTQSPRRKIHGLRQVADREPLRNIAFHERYNRPHSGVSDQSSEIQR